MTIKQIQPNSFRVLWGAVRFAIFGVGGTALMLFFSVDFFSGVIRNHLTLVSPFISLPLAIAGALLMLFGAGEWGRWAYLWVVLCIPASIALLWFLPLSAFGFWIAFFLILLIVSNEVVRWYYRDRGVSKEDKTQNQVSRLSSLRRGAK